MTGKKILFLFLALLLPVVIFIFLKTFGQNEFQVPVLHQDSIPARSSDCNIRYTTPYRIADSVMAQFEANGRDSLYVVYFDESQRAAMTRISVEFHGDPISVVAGEEAMPASQMQALKDCILLMEDQTSITLIDHQGRLRGYYNGSDRDEVDRLIVEMKIILKRY